MPLTVVDCKGIPARRERIEAAVEPAGQRDLTGFPNPPHPSLRIMLHWKHGSVQDHPALEKPEREGSIRQVVLSTKSGGKMRIPGSLGLRGQRHES